MGGKSPRLMVGGSNTSFPNVQDNEACNNHTLKGVDQGHAIAKMIRPACNELFKFLIRGSIISWT